MKVIQELAKVDLGKAKLPDRKIGENEHKVGVIGDDLKRLWCLRSRAHDALKEPYMELKRELDAYDALQEGGCDSRCHAEYHCRIAKMMLDCLPQKQTYDALDNIFWEAVRLEFPELFGKSVGIREGWVIVWMEEKENPIAGIVLPSVVRRLLGL